MIDTNNLKNMMKNLGADLVGIAPVERFVDAPDGFHPKDIYPATKSVIAYAKRLPNGVFGANNYVPYTFATNTITYGVHRIACDIAIKLHDLRITAVPIPSEPYEYWDQEKCEGRGILSLRHAAYLAGLGVLGRNTLIINERNQIINSFELKLYYYY